MNTSPEINDLVTALMSAHKGFKPVLRNTKGQVGQNREYKYADLAGLLDATMPALLEHGVVLVQGVDAESQTLVSRLCHTSGQWIESAYPLGKYERPQDFGSQLSYARRYSLLALLGVAQEDDDGAGAQDAKEKPETSQEDPYSRPAHNASASAPQSRPAAAKQAPTKGALISEPQQNRLYAIATSKRWPSKDAINAYLLTCGYRSAKDIPRSHYDDVVAGLEAGPPIDLVGLMTKAAERAVDFAAMEGAVT